ncbi:HalOD1 output domain-containing protein [Halomontanus rarus]|uniref:HalOD1 output domain-containing protein n=1 Tax=Halomontanus rarus TaxID=3034020 RepID=UPI00293BB2BC|nr:HalOD1 output domain-containing protein [Halovivax sp. KZCA124]
MEMTRSITAKIITKVARYEEVNPIELPPMWDSIDPEALDLLIQSSSDETALRLKFSYYGYNIVVGEKDELDVAPK